MSQPSSATPMSAQSSKAKYAVVDVRISTEILQKKIDADVPSFDASGRVRVAIAKETKDAVRAQADEIWDFGKLWRDRQGGVRDVRAPRTSGKRASLRETFRCLYGDLQGAVPLLVRARCANVCSEEVGSDDTERLLADVDRAVNLAFPALQEFDDRGAYREATMSISNYDAEKSRKIKQTLKKERDYGLHVVRDVESRRSSEWCERYSWKPAAREKKRRRFMTWSVFLSPYPQEVPLACKALGIDLRAACPETAVECVGVLNSLFRRKALALHPDKLGREVKKNGDDFARLCDAKSLLLRHVRGS